MIQRALWTGLLAFVVFVASMLYHLPAAWLWLKVSAYVPATIVLSQVEGRVWQGAAQVRWQNVDLGRVVWRLHPWPLLQAKAALSLDWQGLTLAIEADRQTLALALQDGQIDLAQLSALPLAQLWGGVPMQGKVDFSEVALRWPYQQSWLSAWQGRVQMRDVAIAMFDIEAEQVEWTPVLAGDEWNIALQAQQAAAWQLRGDVTLFRDRRYALNLSLQADAPGTQPMWAKTLMKADTPILSHYRAQGRW